MTYNELDDLSDQLAAGLRNGLNGEGKGRGVRKGDRVAVMCEFPSFSLYLREWQRGVVGGMDERTGKVGKILC